MSYDECGEFLQYFYKRTANVEPEIQRWWNWDVVLNVGHSDFSIDKEKIDRFQIALDGLQEISYDNLLDDKKIDYNNINASESYIQYSNLIQKSAIVFSLLKHEKLFNVKDAERPFINISNPSDNRYKYLTISYYTFKKFDYSNTGITQDDGKLITKTITLSDVFSKRNDDYLLNLCKKFKRDGLEFFNIATDDIIKKNMQDYVTSTAISKTTDAISEDITKSTAKSVLTTVGPKLIPIVGDLAMTCAQIDEDRKKRKAEITYYNKTSENFDHSFVYSKLDLYGVAIESEENDTCSFYVQPSENTESLINEYNSKYGDKYGYIALENALKADEKVYNSLDKANSEANK